MDVEPVDLGNELRQGLQLRLPLAPVVICGPVACELLHRGELHALGLIRDGLLFGPLRVRDAATEVQELLFRNVDAEGADGGLLLSEMGHGGLLMCRPSNICSMKGTPCKAHHANEV